MIFKIPEDIFISNRGETLFVKNLYSPIGGMIRLDNKDSSSFEGLLEGKRVYNPYTYFKFLLQDLLLLPWKSQSNYSIKTEKKKHTNFSYWIHTTNACNLACTYCYINKTSDKISDEVVERIPNMLSDLKEQGYQSVKYKFAGGEPMLNFTKIVEIFEKIEVKAEELGVKTNYTIISNGTLINDEIIKFLQENNKIRLAISLDGMGEYHDKSRVFTNGKGTFEVIERNIDRYIEAGIKPYLSVTVTKDSVKGLKYLYKFIDKKGLQFSINIVRENSCTTSFEGSEIALDDEFTKSYKQAIEDFRPYLKKNHSILSVFSDRARLDQWHTKTCGVDENYLVMDNDGSIHKCQMSISENIKSGTIFDENWLSRVSEPEKRLNVDVEEKDGCRDCKWKYLCTGGCPLITEYTYGTSKRKNPNCDLYQAIFPQILDLEAERLYKFG